MPLKVGYPYLHFSNNMGRLFFSPGKARIVIGYAAATRYFEICLTNGKKDWVVILCRGLPDHLTEGSRFYKSCMAKPRLLGELSICVVPLLGRCQSSCGSFKVIALLDKQLGIALCCTVSDLSNRTRCTGSTINFSAFPHPKDYFLAWQLLQRGNRRQSR